MFAGVAVVNAPECHGISRAAVEKSSLGPFSELNLLGKEEGGKISPGLLAVVFTIHRFRAGGKRRPPTWGTELPQSIPRDNAPRAGRYACCTVERFEIKWYAIAG